MTKQGSDYVGSIRIGGGFRGKIPSRNYEYPPDRLTEFLKLNIDNKEEFYKFCSDYQLTILPKNEVIDEIKDEQALLKAISIKLFAEEILNNSEIKLINLRLAKIKTVIGYPASNNGGIQNTPSRIKEQFQERHLTINKMYTSVFASFWEELITHFVKNQDIKQCKNCTNFFVPLSRHEQLYCSSECANALKQARHRVKKRGKK